MHNNIKLKMESDVSNLSVTIIGRLYDPSRDRVKFIVQMETKDAVWRGNSFQ